MPVSEIINNIQWGVWPFLTVGSALVIGPAFYIGMGKKDCTDNRHITKENQVLQQAYKAIQNTEWKLRSIIAATNEGLWVTNPETGKITDVNAALCGMLGYTRDELIGKTTFELADSKNQILMQQRGELSPSTTHNSYEIELKTKGGDPLHVQINATKVNSKEYFGKDGKESMSFAFINDISARKIHEDKLYRQAHYDTTTGMPNRHFLIQHIKALIGANEKFGLLLIDMDNFKLYNDTFGHSFGDDLLKKIFTQLKDNIHETDFLARFEGDEFVIVSRQQIENIEGIAKKALKLFTDHPIITKHNDIYVSISVGIASYPKDGDDVDHLMRCADLALHHAKNHGKGQVSIYNKTLDRDLLEKLEMGNKLRTALCRNEFSLMYQPQIAMTTGKIIGVEALLRWNNSELGSVPPARFIPILESTGLIVPVGEWVLRESCSQASTWNSNGESLRMSVNLSSRQLQEADFATTIKTIIAETCITPDLLMLEITESLLIGDLDRITKRLEPITDLGVRFSIDDFGTGYSSLSYLQKLPIKEIKIDRAFITNLSKNNGDGDTVIVKTIVAMANSFGMETVAEGVEDQSQLQTLAEVGATMVQSYLTGRPMLPEQITKILTRDRMPTLGLGDVDKKEYLCQLNVKTK